MVWLLETIPRAELVELYPKRGGPKGASQASQQQASQHQAGAAPSVTYRLVAGKPYTTGRTTDQDIPFSKDKAVSRLLFVCEGHPAALVSLAAALMARRRRGHLPSPPPSHRASPPPS